MMLDLYEMIENLQKISRLYPDNQELKELLEQYEDRFEEYEVLLEKELEFS